MRFVFAVILLVCVDPASLRADDDNPYKAAKVGDWVEYKYSARNFAAPRGTEATIKMTVIAKDDKELTYEIGGWVPGVVQKVKIDLTKPHDPIGLAALSNYHNFGEIKGLDFKAEKLAEGKEKLKVGGKEYDTRWTQMKHTIKFTELPQLGERTYVILAKTWVSKDVPLSGQVILETNDGSQMRLELSGFGRK